MRAQPSTNTRLCQQDAGACHASNVVLVGARHTLGCARGAAAVQCGAPGRVSEGWGTGSGVRGAGHKDGRARDGAQGPRGTGQLQSRAQHALGGAGGASSTHTHTHARARTHASRVASPQLATHAPSVHNAADVVGLGWHRGHLGALPSLQKLREGLHRHAGVAAGRQGRLIAGTDVDHCKRVGVGWGGGTSGFGGMRQAAAAGSSIPRPTQPPTRVVVVLAGRHRLGPSAWRRLRYNITGVNRQATHLCVRGP